MLRNRKLLYKNCLVESCRIAGFKKKKGATTPFLTLMFHYTRLYIHMTPLYLGEHKFFLIMNKVTIITKLLLFGSISLWVLFSIMSRCAWFWKIESSFLVLLLHWVCPHTSIIAENFDGSICLRFMSQWAFLRKIKFFLVTVTLSLISKLFWVMEVYSIMEKTLFF